MIKGEILEFLKKNKIGIRITCTIVAVGLIGAIGYGVYENGVKDNENISLALDLKENTESDNLTSDDKEKASEEKKEVENDGQAKEDIASVSKNAEEKNNNDKNAIKKPNGNKTESNSASSNNSNKNTANKTEDKTDNKKEPSKPSNSDNKKPVTPAKPTSLAEKIANTKTAQNTNQIILASGRSVSLWNKDNGKWNKVLEAVSRIGHNGFISPGNKREGDKSTPTGSYPILYGFGLLDNPGTSLGYRKITQNSYFVDDPQSKYYNQWYEGTGEKGEHMIDYPEYKYGMVIGYNASHTPGKGSAIFFHNNGRGNTAGCISIPEISMLSLLKSTRQGAYVIITSSDDNLKYY